MFDCLILLFYLEKNERTTTEFWPLLWLFASNCLSDQLICMSFLCANSILEFDEKFFLLLWKIFWCHWSIDFPAQRSEQICNLNISANGNLLEVFQGKKLSIIVCFVLSNVSKLTKDKRFSLRYIRLSVIGPNT